MRRVAAVLMMMAALAACARTTSEQNTEPPLGPLVSVRSEQDIDLPLQRYESTGELVTTVHKARTILNLECAIRFGTVYTDPAISDPDMMIRVSSRRYGIVDANQARRHGYRVSAQGAPAEAGSSKFTEADWRPSRRELLVMTGTTPDGTVARADKRPIDDRGAPLPAGGCTAETEHRLDAGLVPVNPQYLPNLQGQSYQMAEQDQRVVDAWRKWSGCMRTQGYRYRSPWEPNDQIWGPQLTATEKETAQADVQCRQRTRMTDIWMAVESAYQTQLIQRHPDELKALADYNAGRLANARDILSHR